MMYIRDVPRKKSKVWAMLRGVLTVWAAIGIVVGLYALGNYSPPIMFAVLATLFGAFIGFLKSG